MIGIDVVPVERLRALLQRSEVMEQRLFTSGERAYCVERNDPIKHLAGTLAAKEAVIKALRLGSLAAYARRIEVARDADGVPSVTIEGHPECPTLSISHDGGVAVAVAVVTTVHQHAETGGGDNSTPLVERAGPGSGGVANNPSPGLRPNVQLADYMRGNGSAPSERGARSLVDATSVTFGTDFP